MGARWGGLELITVAARQLGMDIAPAMRSTTVRLVDIDAAAKLKAHVAFATVRSATTTGKFDVRTALIVGQGSVRGRDRQRVGFAVLASAAAKPEQNVAFVLMSMSAVLASGPRRRGAVAVARNARATAPLVGLLLALRKAELVTRPLQVAAAALQPAAAVTATAAAAAVAESHVRFSQRDANTFLVQIRTFVVGAR